MIAQIKVSLAARSLLQRAIKDSILFDEPMLQGSTDGSTSWTVLVQTDLRLSALSNWLSENRIPFVKITELSQEQIDLLDL